MATTDPLCQSFLDLWWHFDPAAATRSGAVDHDGRLGAFDPETVREHVAALRSIAGAVEDLDVPLVSDEIDRTALLDHLRVQLFRFEHEHPWKRNPALWIEHAADALSGLLPLAAGDPNASAALLARLQDLPRFLGSLVESLRQPPTLLVDTAVALLDELTALVRACGLQGDAWAQPVEEGLDTLRRARHALLTQVSADPAPHGAAIGEEEVDRRLHHEHASVFRAAEVWRSALRAAAESEAEVVALAAAVDASRPWRDVYEQRRASMPAPGEWTVVFGFALRAAGQFAAGRGMAGADQTPLGCSEAPPHLRVLQPAAAYRPPAARLPAALLVGEPDPLAAPWVAVQLGSPGLHLHYARRDELPGLVRRHIEASSTPLGWGLYAVEWMRSEGYANAPELQLACGVHLLSAVHLALADVGFHIRQFSTEEAINHLAGRLPIDRATALAEVRRIACRPLESCAALLGLRELRRLREAAAAARGAGFEASAFHQAVLSFGGLPVPLIRWGMGLDG